MAHNEQLPKGKTPESEHLKGCLPAAGSRNNSAGINPQQESDSATIKDVTKENYARIVRHLVRFSTDKRSSDPLEPVLVSPEELVDDLFERRGTLAENSYATYRSALLWHLLSHKGNPIYDAATDKLYELSAAGAPEGDERSRGVKLMRTIPENDLHLLLEQLTSVSDSSRWAYRALYWLQAALGTGLRPIEWKSAEWLDHEKTRLQVSNAKIKASAPAFMRRKGETGQPASFEPVTGHALAHTSTTQHEGNSSKVRVLTGIPENRIIPVEDKRDRFNIEIHMRLIAEQLAEGVSFDRYYEECRRALWRACGKLWAGKKRYSLYSARGQYSANQRAAVGSPTTSTLMGHSRPDSPSASHYGKANQAHKRYAERRSAGDRDVEGASLEGTEERATDAMPTATSQEPQGSSNSEH